MAKIAQKPGAYMRAPALIKHLGLEEVATPPTIRNWAAEGAFPRPLLIGGKIELFDVSECEKWLAERKAARDAA